MTQAVDFDFTLAAPPSGTVDLQGAQVSYLHDNKRSRPESAELDGFVHGSIKSGEVGDGREAVRRRNSVAQHVPGGTCST
ncbi:hypothetical protein ACFWPQ_20540 [Streptomyces sp. NPDC058464]|uniref:hypothetical protein n=1 Tax=Streptomyces sp. NPDC058464 TaxID=3346511 RepID=UPI0036648F38